MTEDKTDERGLVEEWLKKINEAEKVYAKYYELVDETRDFYKDSKGSKSGKYNIFWSSVETLKPFLYFKQPKFYVERSNKNAGKAEKLACEMLENALKWDLEQFDFDSVIKYARNDFLISGAGIVWEQYKPVIETQPDPLDPESEIAVKTGEKVESVYLDPRYFLTDTDRVGVWEDVTWIARKIYMDREAAEEEFDEEFSENGGGRKDVCIYEIWDKTSGKIYWLSRAVADKFLKVSDNLLNVNGFFPCPKPIFATMTNNSIIPVPDYCMIREMLNELNGINSRMKLTMQALKVSGAYDNAFPELADILSKDVTLVAVSDFVKLRENGGIRGVVDFAPIEQYVTALEQLAVRRQDVIASIFDVTGVSDIMRGSSDGSDTATAVVKKTNFGTLRNQDRQNDMQRFLCDLLRIKAEIICEHFSEDTLVQFVEDEAEQQYFTAALSILRQDKTRNLTFGIETDGVFDQEAENAKALETVKTISDIIQSAFGVVSQQPALLPLYRKMVESVVIGMPNARQYQNVLEQVFARIEQELSQPEPEQQPEQDPRVAVQMQKNQQEYEIKKEQNAIKRGELELKRWTERMDAALTEKEMDLQAALTEQKIQQGDNPSTNITFPGKVPSFERS
mgnify:CR=1 FL=1